jgi:hypothetical protein
MNREVVRRRAPSVRVRVPELEASCTSAPRAGWQSNAPCQVAEVSIFTEVHSAAVTVGDAPLF